jgi:uncharacterized protein
LRNAKTLLQSELTSSTEPIDGEVVILAAILHDVGDFKLTKDHSLQLPHILQVIDQGESKAREHGIPPISQEKREFICQIICNMSFLKEIEQSPTLGQPEVCKTMEFKIFQDADRLDATGAIGLARCFAYTRAVGRSIVLGNGNFSRYKEAADSLTAERYNRNLSKAANQDSDAVSHLYEKILKLPWGEAREKLRFPPNNNSMPPANSIVRTMIVRGKRVIFC